MRPVSAVLAVFLFVAFCAMGWGCANITPPGGGPRDTLAPVLLKISPQDSLLNARPKKVDLQFDEFVVLADASTQVQISPLLSINPIVTSNLRRVSVTIPDTLLQDSTTYRISFGNAIQDLHENNPFRNYTYTFSTTTYFDSLRLDGIVYEAETGLVDTGASMLLYPLSAGDSGIVKNKPLYVTTTDAAGRFSFKGLPGRSFRIYALKDKNTNLVLDGDERVAFADAPVRPALDSAGGLILRTFEDITVDTAAVDSAAAEEEPAGGRGLLGGRDRRDNRNAGKGKEPAFTYDVAVDTGDVRRRTYEITQPMRIVFAKQVASINADRVFLNYDSSGIAVEAPVDLRIDTANNTIVMLETPWREDMIYTLRLLKGFAKDTAGGDALPSKYTFRTKRDEDYAKLHIHLPTRFGRTPHVLQVTANGTDTIYNKKVTDTMVHLLRLQPGTYSILVIRDDNNNGKWDRGNLFQKLQPELVLPHGSTQTLKAGWENMIDFDGDEKKYIRAAPRPQPPPATGEK